MRLVTARTAQFFCDRCPLLTRITWNGADGNLVLTGQRFRNAAKLTEVYMDGSRFFRELEPRYFEDEPNDGSPNLHVKVLQASRVCEYQEHDLGRFQYLKG
jgi:hypothetical protein